MTDHRHRRLPVDGAASKASARLAVDMYCCSEIQPCSSSRPRRLSSGDVGRAESLLDASMTPTLLPAIKCSEGG